MVMLEAALNRQRWIVGGAIAVLAALAWSYTVHLADVMSTTDPACQMSAADMARAVHVGMPMPVPAAPWGITDITTHFVMWAVMMVAMMLPSAAPAILIFLRAAAQHPAGRAVTPAALFVCGYLACWTLFSAAATALQWVLHDFAYLAGNMAFDSRLAAGAALIAAGVYQWSPLKYDCLRHCQSPIGFLFGHWKDGLAGAFEMGLRHGVYCVGCCWLLMLLLFAVGVMNLLWVAGLAIYVLAEKVVPVGPRLARATGLVAIVWGGLLLVGRVSL
jgi:predicted metal-binding membrane protein